MIYWDTRGPLKASFSLKRLYFLPAAGEEFFLKSYFKRVKSFLGFHFKFHFISRFFGRFHEMQQLYCQSLKFFRNARRNSNALSFKCHTKQKKSNRDYFLIERALQRLPVIYLFLTRTRAREKRIRSWAKEKSLESASRLNRS